MSWHESPRLAEANPHEVIRDDLLADLALEARPYQKRIVSKAVAMFAGAHRNRHGELERAANSVMIESPTGSGKTIMGLAIARHLQRAHGFKVGWVAMRRNLLTQAREENERRGFQVAMETISMFDKAPPPVDLLVVDEAQHDAAMSMANLHCQIRPKKILGLTATPYRADRVKLCFEKVITDAGIHALIQDGYLSRYHHYTIPEYTPASVAEFYLKDAARWGKALVFFHRLDQCQACHAALRAGGVPAEIVTAKSDRERQLDDFHADRLKVLVNMAILTEGFDCPSLKTVFCRPSGKSCTIQMAGRVYRKHADAPFKQVVQCRKTPHPMIKTALADEQYVWLDDDWRTLKLNARINAITQRSRQLLAQTNVELPKVVLTHRQNQAPWRERER